MALATYKDLCVDANDAARLGAFWSDALDLELQLLADGDARLIGPTPQHTVWVNTVPEPVTVKQRVHLDLHVASVTDVLELGATVVDRDSFGWQVLRDPEGGELCTFEREQLPAERLYEIVVDCADPGPLAAWWAELLGARLGHVGPDMADGAEEAYVERIPGAPFEFLVFGSVPEPKTVKNRIHPDVVCADVPALVAHGATILRERDDEVDWTVLADPEGNEFCAFLPAPSGVAGEQALT
jgi:hypothetical protein